MAKTNWKLSGELTAQARQMVKQDPVLARFPVQGAVTALIAGAVIGIPGMALIALDETPSTVAGVILIVLAAYAATFVMTKAMAGLVYGANAVLNKETITYGDAKKGANTHTGALAAWAGITLAVNWLLNVLRGEDDDANMGLKIFQLVAAALGSAAWSLITFFVLPVIVIEGLGAGAATKRSAHLIRETFGKAVLGGVRIGARYGFMFTLPGVILVVGGVIAMVAGHAGIIALGAILIVAGAVLVIVGAVMNATVRNVFGVALYRYATTGKADGPFTVEHLQAVAASK